MFKLLVSAALLSLSSGAVLPTTYNSPMNVVNDPGYNKPKPSSAIDDYLRGDGYDSSYKPTIAPSVPTSGGTPSAAINCREFILTLMTSKEACANVKQGDLNIGASSSDIGFCRWDAVSSSCWCPRPKALCDEVKQCYWNKDPSLTGNTFLLQFAPSSGECISNAERFYNILSNLLLKRGKKDFAIRINYSSAPARGQLPLGPYGPAIIGAGSSIQGMMPPAYMTPTQGYGDPNAGYGLPTQAYPSYGAPMAGYGYPMPSYGAPMPSYGAPMSSYGMPSYPSMSGYQYS